MNNKLLLLVTIIFGLILTALILRNGNLLLLAVPVLSYVAVGLFQAPRGLELAAFRQIDKPAAAAQELISTRIVIRNNGDKLTHLYLKDSLPPGVILSEGQVHQRLALPAGESTEIKYAFRAPRGIYSWHTLHACASDPFGLMDRECEVPASGEILVRPVPLPIRPKPLKPRFTLHSAGPISARLAGSGTDFWGVREYQAGDSLRRINWRMAARHPHKNFTNEYEREEIADFGLILDARKLSHADSMEEALFEYSVSAAASLSENFLSSGNRVSLFIFGESALSVFPGYGKHHLNVMLRTLARARQGGNIPFSHLEYFPTRLFPTRSLIVIFSAVGPHDLETYARLRSFGYDVLLITPDPVDFASRIVPSTEMNSLAVRAARVERAVQLKRLLKLGVNVVDWQVDKSLETIMNHRVRHRVHRRNL